MASNPATPAAPATPAHAAGGDTAHHGQQHPIGLYLKIWLLLFVLSALSYMVDYFHVSGYLRWTLILLFMGLKAGLIVAVFMHMAWERMALICAILIPPLCLLVLVWLMAEEANHTFLTRGIFFR
ncbi:cytochrome C oxidase subunit IV family protein [Cupriavidus alkaliphilus]|uniref:cytochrome C oxidase subunit IV family protein n=1 Tax=Cupriavidus alkaliphilus TaxID=942866 RepID=UPI00160A24C6|nr:cytochrome C oxidase subunit IV family protein [Cupriavidus alkaliphilus]MBB3013232.1 cytochrome c oxidase subunit IV [Cupriavidus alkaliphilus]